MTDLDKIRQIVRRALSKRLPDVPVLAINLRPYTLPDGEEIVRINVVFDDKEVNIIDIEDPTELTQEAVEEIQRWRDLTSQIIDEMQRLGDPRFPSLSRIAKSDLGKKNPEAA